VIVGMFSVNTTAGGLSNAGHGFCMVGSRVFQEIWDADIAWWRCFILAFGRGNWPAVLGWVPGRAGTSSGRKAARGGGFEFKALRTGLRYALHLNGDGFREFEAEGGLGGQDNLLIPGIGRSRGSRASTHCCADEGSFATAGKAADEGPATSSAADHGCGALAFAL